MNKTLLNQYKRTFHFSVSVSYDFILKRGYGEKDYITPNASMKCDKVWKQKQVPTRKGVVVGWRWLSNGIGDYDSDNGNSYTATQSIFAIEVKRGMLNKVDLVLPESLSIHVRFYDPTCDPVPKPFTIPDRVPTMTNAEKSWLRNEMKSVPRDSKGRWK